MAYSYTNRALRKLADKLRQSQVERGKIHSVDGERVSLLIGSSPSAVRNIEVIGDISTLKVGDEVSFTRVNNRPVVLAGGAAQVIGSSVIQELSGAGNSGELVDHAHSGTGDGGTLSTYMRKTEHAAAGQHSYATNLPHDDHGLLSGLLDDDHTQYASAEGQGTRSAYQAERLNKSVLTENGLQGGGDLSATRTLSVKLPANSGLVADAAGLRLGTPAAHLSASSLDQVLAGSHTHAVDASAAPGAAESLLKTTPEGGLTLAALAVSGAETIGQDLTVGANVLFVDQSAGLVGINCVPDPQFQLDVNANIRARGYIVGKHAIQLKDAKMICHYDGPDPFATNTSGDLTGHMGQVGSPYGGIRFTGGRFNKALTLGEATTNLLANASFESGIWNGYGTPTTRATAADWAVEGLVSAHLIGDSSGDGCFSSAGTLTSGVTYTASVYVKHISGARPRLMVAKNVSPFTVYGTVTAPADFYEGRISVTFTMPETTAVNFVLLCDAGESYFDCAQLEQKAYLTAWVDGTRTATTVVYKDPCDHLKGTWMAWVRLDNIAGTFVLMDARSSPSGTNAPRLYSTTYGKIVWNYNATNIIDTVDNSLGDLGWHHVAVTYDFNTGNQAIYMDGVQKASVTASGPIDWGTTLTVGSNYARSANWPGQVDDVVIVGRVLGANEILAIYQSDAPVFAESSTWAFKSASQLVWADAEGLWAIDQDGNAAFGVSGVDGKSWGGATLDKGDILLGRSASYAKWDASAAQMSFYGNGAGLTAINGANIQTGTVTADQITVATLSALSANLGTVTAGSLVIGSTNKLWLNDAADGSLQIGGGTKASAPFRVTAAGALTAANATITGAVNASSGSISGTLEVTGSLVTDTVNPRVVLGSTQLAGFDSGGNRTFYISATDGIAYAGGGNLKLDKDGYWQKVNGIWGKMGDQIGAGYSRSTGAGDAAVSFSNASEAYVPFNGTTMLDFNLPTGAGFINTTNYNNIYIPHAGVYLITGYAEFAFTAAAKPFIQLGFRVLNSDTTVIGGTLYARQHFIGPGDGLNYKPSIALSHVMYLAAGQRVYMAARIANNSVALNLEAASFTVIKLM